jgi:hypothetical protein
MNENRPVRPKISSSFYESVFVSAPDRDVKRLWRNTLVVDKLFDIKEDKST